MSRVYDTDGTPLRRTPDGDLVPDQLTDDAPVRAGDPARGTSRGCASPALPASSDVLCREHGTFGYTAARCPMCWSEIKSGDRPYRCLGRHYAGGDR